MKKLLLLFLLVGGIVVAKADGTLRRDIQISDVSNPIRPDQIRSLVQVAEAWIDYDMGCIEVEINATLGLVDVVITDMAGIPVAKATIDTNTVPYTMLPIPAEGMYTLTISGGEYLGTGNFTIE